MYRILRFKVKKSIFFCVAAVTVLLVATVCVSAFAAENDKVTVPVIMYHSILDDASRTGKYVITPAELEKDMKWLTENGYTAVTVQALIDYTKNNGELPDKPVLLTFDDGYYNNYLYAYPLAQKYNMHIVISPIGYYSDEYSKEEKLSPYYSHCTWNQIEEMADSGLVEFENHTYNLHKSDGARLGAKQLAGENLDDYTHMLIQDITEIQDKISSTTGTTPTCFVYPFGAISKNTPQIIKNCGFLMTLTCEERMNTVTREPDSLFNLGRYLRTQSRSAQSIIEKNIK